MSPTAGIAAAQLKQLIYYHLDNEMVDNASFLAARFHALEPRNPDAAHLLALTYFRSRRFKAAYDFGHKYGANGRHLGCAYIFAQACLELGRNQEGITALERSRGLWGDNSEWKKHSETSRRHVPDAPAALNLLGKLWQAHGQLQKAGDSYIEAHKQNPFIWDAFEGLCKIGADLKVGNMFKLEGESPGMDDESDVTHVYVDEDSRRPLAPQQNVSANNVFAMDDPFVSSQTDAGRDDAQVVAKSMAGLRPVPFDWDTPTAGNIIMPDADVIMDEDDVFGIPPAAPSRKARLGQQFETSDRSRVPAMSRHGVPQEPLDYPQHAPRKPSVGGQKRTISGALPAASTDSAQPRRSNRLFTQTTTSTTRATRSAMDSTAASIAGRADRTARTAKAATGTRGRTGVVGRVVSGNRKIMPPDEKEKDRRVASRQTERTTGLPQVTSITLQKPPPPGPLEADVQANRQVMCTLLDNFRHLALGVHSSAKYDLPNAIHSFRNLPIAQRETPWVLAQLGKAYHEEGDFRQSDECFARLIKMQPSRVEDMEIYSTVLWHLKKEQTLAFLCRLLRDTHFEAPQTWVAVGNALSLSREHDQAISAFKRATQLDENFAYAWTLMGHEYIASEAFESALSSFRKAVTVDRRHYNGWYGLGKCYERMGKFEDAERHYRIANAINPTNSTLLVCIGVVLERLRNKKGALANYARALELTPGSALARFKKARVLMHMKYHREALVELELLRDSCPDEANVWFLLGKCYKGLQDKPEALRAFTTALNLDAKAAPFIKEAMESLDEEDVDSDDD